MRPSSRCAAWATCCGVCSVARSLRRRLLAGVMLPLLGAVAVDGWISWRDAQATAGLMQDRLLLGAARIVAEQLHWQDGALPSQVPPAALELFEAGEADRVYYRVSTADGHIVTGYAELVPPAVPLQPEVPHFFGAAVRGQPVRAVAYLQPVPGERGVEPVTVAIAQTMNGHAAQVRSLWARSMGQQALLLALVAALVLLGLRRVLRPLLALRDAVLSREAGSLQPLAVPAMPHELQPLVAAINDYARRLDQYAGAQRSFLQNAAHQLRTPLTVLTTQVNYALRADGAQRQESLEAIRGTVAHSGRLVNQMLMLSAAEAQAEAGEVDAATAATDLVPVLQQVLEQLAGQAGARQIDLGFEQEPPGPAWVAAPPLALREIATNLVDNALRYTPPGGIVTARVEVAAGEVLLRVEDNGPGIPPEERERVFQRFYRLRDADSAGSGLGLPIVREFATRIGATVSLQDGPGGRGLAVVVRLPAAH